MTFRRINDTTINCIISPEDLHDHGIQIDDLFDRKEEAMEFLRRAIVEAAKAENFNLQGEYTSMRITVLPDHSLSLTLTENIPGAEQASKKRKETQAIRHTLGERAQGRAGAAPEIEYALVFSSMENVMSAAGRIAAAGDMESSLYMDEEDGCYYLFVTRNKHTGNQFEQLVLSSNEFGSLLSEGPEFRAYIREHKKCILREKAVQTLNSL